MDLCFLVHLLTTVFSCQNVSKMKPTCLTFLKSVTFIFYKIFYNIFACCYFRYLLLCFTIALSPLPLLISPASFSHVLSLILSLILLPLPISLSLSLFVRFNFFLNWIKNSLCWAIILNAPCNIYFNKWQTYGFLVLFVFLFFPNNYSLNYSLVQQKLGFVGKSYSTVH